MLKFLLILLVSLFTAPVTIKNNNVNSGDSFCQSSINVVKKENEQPTYPYTEMIDGHGAIVRTYATSAFAPTLVKTFKAPSGFSAHLHIEEDQLDILMNELDSIDPDYSRAVMPAYYYRIAGSSVFVDGDYYTSSDLDRRTQIKDQFRDSLNNFTLFCNCFNICYFCWAYIVFLSKFYVFISYFIYNNNICMYFFFTKFKF